MRIDRAVPGRLMDLLDPFVSRVLGAHINRRTVENVARAGLQVVSLESYGPMRMVKLIVARPPS